MNKSILSFLLLLSPFFVMAKGSSHQTTSDSPKSNIVDISYAQRILIYEWSHNEISVDGIILVCDRKYKVFRQGTCNDSNDQNQWMDIENIRIPNFELTGFEYRWHSTGNRVLLLYFSKKK